MRIGSVQAMKGIMKYSEKRCSSQHVPKPSNEIVACCSDRTRTLQFDQIEYENGDGDDDRLTDFETIDASQDVDRIGTEDGDHTHVDVVQQT